MMISYDYPNSVVADAIANLVRDGRFVFCCPRCREMLAYVNPKNNRAHCFVCHANFNTIDLMQPCGHDFRSAVALLERWLERTRPGDPTEPRRDARFAAGVGIIAIVFSRIRRNSGKLSSRGPNSYGENSATNATTIRCATVRLRKCGKKVAGP